MTTTLPERLQPVITALRDRFDWIDSEEITGHRGEVTLEIPPERLVEVCEFLRDDEATRFEHLSDLSGTDYPDRPDRFCVDYHLYSFDHNVRLRVKVRVGGEQPHLTSVTSIWPTADFQEREVYDFFGVRFDGHPNLIRILMPEDWLGYPLRKDYPLGGVDVDYQGVHITPPETRSYRGGWTSR